MADPKPNLPTDDTPHRDAMDDIYRKLDDAAPIDLGERIVLGFSVVLTREEFAGGGPDAAMKVLREVSIAARDALKAEITKRRWKFDF